MWLPLPGYLMFLLPLHVPLAALPVPKIVLMQCLFALAVTEVCRAPGVLGGDRDKDRDGDGGMTGDRDGRRTMERVRIKWPTA